MRTIILAAAAATALTSTAQAAPSRAALEYSEIRRSAIVGQYRRSEVIQLAPDGTFSGIYHAKRHIARGIERRNGVMKGRWSLKGNAICFEGSGLEYDGQNCYRLTKAKHTKEQWSGTNMKTGNVWQFFVYQARDVGTPRRAAR